MALQTSTFITDATLFIRDLLRANVTDPLSRSGSGTEWIFSGFPEKTPQYPTIIIENESNSDVRRLGQQSQGMYLQMQIKIRVWGRKVVEKDTLAQAVYDTLRSNQLSVAGTVQDQIFNFRLLSSVDVDEPGEKGAQGIHSKIMRFGYDVVLI